MNILKFLRRDRSYFFYFSKNSEKLDEIYYKIFYKKKNQLFF